MSLLTTDLLNSSPKIDRAAQKFYKKVLGREKQTKSKVFKYMYTVFYYSAIVGYKKQVSKPVKDNVTGGVFKWSNLPDKYLRNLLIISIANSGSLEITKDINIILSDIEQHAHGGLDELTQQYSEDPQVFSDVESFINNCC